MLLNKSLKIMLIGAGLLALTACSTTGDTSTSGDMNSSGTGSDPVKVTGVATNSGFSGSELNGNAKALEVGNQTYYYNFDKSDVKSSDLASIKVQSNYLISHPNAKVLLAGNTDERGSREYNIGLGQRRADSVKNILLSAGVSAKQITTVSYGAEKPVALGHTEEDYQKNRRVDLTYQTPINK